MILYPIVMRSLSRRAILGGITGTTVSIVGYVNRSYGSNNESSYRYETLTPGESDRTPSDTQTERREKSQTSTIKPDPDAVIRYPGRVIDDAQTTSKWYVNSESVTEGEDRAYMGSKSLKMEGKNGEDAVMNKRFEISISRTKRS